MKTNFFSRKVTGLAITAGLLFIGSSYALSQTIIRQCISSLGSSGNLPGLYLNQTAGQCFGTFVSDSEYSSLLPGFQQNFFSVTGDKTGDIKETASTMRVYPNPASREFYIGLPDYSENDVIVVVNSLGQNVCTITTNGNIPYLIDCSTWKPGVYVLMHGQSANSRNSIKLLISK